MLDQTLDDEIFQFHNVNQQEQSDFHWTRMMPSNLTMNSNNRDSKVSHVHPRPDEYPGIKQSNRSRMNEKESRSSLKKSVRISDEDRDNYPLSIGSHRPDYQHWAMRPAEHSI